MVSLFREDPKHILKTINAHLPVDPRSLAKSVPLPNTEAPGFFPIYRNAFSQMHYLMFLSRIGHFIQVI